MRLNKLEFPSWVTLVLNEAMNPGIDFDKNMSMQAFKSYVMKMLKLNFCNQWLSEVTSVFKFPRLRTYRLFKSTHYFEPYLSLVKIDKHRKALARFRCSSHHLAIESGRWSMVPVVDRLCVICGVLDDEFHFFSNCQSNTSERAVFHNNLRCELGPDAFYEFKKSIVVNSLSSTSSNILNITASFIFRSFKRKDSLLFAPLQRV